MLLLSPLIAAAALLATASAAPQEKRQSAADGTGLSVTAAQFDIDYLQSFRLTYANESAYVGEIKYQIYSEPLVVTVADGSLSFTSIHAAPTGEQIVYVVPHQSKPVGLSPPHGSPPLGVRTTGFSFGPAGNLLNNGLKLFYACQTAADAEINTWQIWWIGATLPTGIHCKGPINIQKSDGCARE